MLADRGCIATAARFHLASIQHGGLDLAHVKANIRNTESVTTINIGIYQDGTIEQSSLDMMRQLRRAIRER